jgi:hypothetical protein
MALNARIQQGVETLIRATGEDPNNPQTTWTGTTFHVPVMRRHEAVRGNPLHLMLAILTLTLIIGWRDLQVTRDMATFSLGLSLAFLLFCAIFRWQPWHTRLHLPLFVLWAPLAGIVLTQVWPPSISSALGTLLLLISIPLVLSNQLRPLVFGGNLGILHQERRLLYFAENPGLLHAFESATEFVKKQGCESIGLDVPVDAPTYPLYVFLDAGSGKRRIQHVGVSNPSAPGSQGGGDFSPCAVICIHCTHAAEKFSNYSLQIGPPTIFQDIVVFIRKRLSAPEGVLR